MATVGDFAKTNNIQIKDVIELAQGLGYSLADGSELITEDLRKNLMLALNQHRHRLGLKDMRKVSSVVGSDRHKIQVVTKKRDVKPFDVQALKKKILSETQETKKEEAVVAPEPVGTPPSIETQEPMTEETPVVLERVEEPSVEPEIVIIETPVVKERADKDAKEPKAAVEKDVKLERSVSKFDDDDARRSKGKSKKSKNDGSSFGHNPAQLDNKALRRFTTQFQTEADEELESPRSFVKKNRKKNTHQFTRPLKPVELTVQIPEVISVSELANLLSLKTVLVLKELMKMGTLAQAGTILDQDTAILVVEELGHKAEPLQTVNPEELIRLEYADEPQARPPIVTIMGHVDHGKTSLLDYIRRSRVAAGEAGGITQHIGAYNVATPHGSVTFLDTPGHAAFTSMRARGAQCTDIAVILIAADDGIMPQTQEAIAHAQAANVPIVVAASKVDKPTADLERLKTQMAQMNLLPEEWGGDVPVLPVSSRSGEGIENFLEILALQAEILELKAPKEGPAQGVIIESSLSRLKGALATVLVQQGTLKVGDLVVCGTQYGRIKALFDDMKRPMKEAGPSLPVQILGLPGVVEAGESLVVVEQEKDARAIVEYRLSEQKKAKAPTAPMKMENFFANSALKELAVILKADTHGSIEAIAQSLMKLSTDEVQLKIVAQSVGGITDSDVMLAKASQAMILGFNVRAEKSSKLLAEKEQVAIEYYSIIYEMINHVKSAIFGLEAPKFQENFVGLAEVRSVFRSSVFGHIAGCLVVEGVVRKDLPIRVLRQNVVIYQGRLESLRRHKDDVQEVRAGTECGIGVKDYNDIKNGDQIEVYQMVEIARQS